MAIYTTQTMLWKVPWKPNSLVARHPNSKKKCVNGSPLDRWFPEISEAESARRWILIEGHVSYETF